MAVLFHGSGDRLGCAGWGLKDPPSAPPAIPPIIINPFNRHTPPPPIDPRQTPVGPPLTPPPGPGWRCAGSA